MKNKAAVFFGFTTVILAISTIVYYRKYKKATATP